MTYLDDVSEAEQQVINRMECIWVITFDWRAKTSRLSSPKLPRPNPVRSARRFADVLVPAELRSLEQ